MALRSTTTTWCTRRAEACCETSIGGSCLRIPSTRDSRAFTRVKVSKPSKLGTSPTATSLLLCAQSSGEAKSRKSTISRLLGTSPCGASNWPAAHDGQCRRASGTRRGLICLRRRPSAPPATVWRTCSRDGRTPVARGRVGRAQAPRFRSMSDHPSGRPRASRSGAKRPLRAPRVRPPRGRSSSRTPRQHPSGASRPPA